MAHRTQITLTDAQYKKLKHESTDTGLSISEIIRRALDSELERRAGSSERLRIIEQTAGLWADRNIDTAKYLKQLRKPMGPMPT